jgi:Polysaccharide pyruvyl transferase
MSYIIKTITCHEVYNHGASLQEFALLKYLEGLGHDAKTIHYKPPYLSEKHDFWKVTSPNWNSNFIKRALYLFLKLPERTLGLVRKNNFDAFAKKNIKTDTILYRSNEELKLNIPHADIYITGSDQVWNFPMRLVLPLMKLHLSLKCL